jgi:glutamyl-Q tRNA(Asp) synthetase
VNANTAIATIDTARAVVGRFAPSPTGPLHLGSLVAAVGSYLDALTHGGHWLVRIEDLDTPRVAPGCATEQLATLEAFGFEWQGPIVYQSTRRDAYRAALEQLARAGHTFECSCSRKTIGDEQAGARYPGTCRSGPTRPGLTATRFRIDDGQHVQFDDAVQGPQSVMLADLGDFVVRRRDDIATYQLAVVIDDAWQNVTRVTRGADLLDSTPWQIALQSALALPPVKYAHLPLITEADGAKLAKSRRSLSLDRERVPVLLTLALSLLQQNPPAELAHSDTREIWQWARANWQLGRVQHLRSVQLSPASDTF